MQKIDVRQLHDMASTFFLDAYGVLVTSAGALPGAADFIKTLNRAGKDYFVMSNDASRLPETCQRQYARAGLEIPLERVLTAGHTIAPALARRGLTKARCIVLGTPETAAMVERAGHQSIAITADAEFDAIVIGDDSGFDFLPSLNAVLTALYRRITKGHHPVLLLANPDFLYPRGGDSFGFTSGAISRLLSEGIQLLHPEGNWAFEPLGKPEKHLFDLGLKAAGNPDPAKVFMLGDQLRTDVLGANRAGCASVLLGTGVTTWPLPAATPVAMQPKFYLPNLL